jgi:hypothetical protein
MSGEFKGVLVNPSESPHGCTWMHTCMHTFIHMHTHTHVHTFITYIFLYFSFLVYTLSPKLFRRLGCVSDREIVSCRAVHAVQVSSSEFKLVLLSSSEFK